MSFDSPFSVQDAVIICLAAAFTQEEWAGLRFHTGAFGTGEAIECCPSGSLLVETGPLTSSDDLGRRWLGRPNGCVELQQIVVVTYRRCYTSQTAQGRKRKDEDLTAQGRALEASGWAAVQALSCCSEYLLRFVSLRPDTPAACAGWTLTLDATVKVCAGCTPNVTPFEVPSTPMPQHISMPTGGIGVAPP